MNSEFSEPEIEEEETADDREEELWDFIESASFLPVGIRVPAPDPQGPYPIRMAEFEQSLLVFSRKNSCGQALPLCVNDHLCRAFQTWRAMDPLSECPGPLVGAYDPSVISLFDSGSYAPKERVQCVQCLRFQNDTQNAGYRLGTAYKFDHPPSYANVFNVPGQYSLCVLPQNFVEEDHAADTILGAQQNIVRYRPGDYQIKYRDGEPYFDQSGILYVPTKNHSSFREPRDIACDSAHGSYFY